MSESAPVYQTHSSPPYISDIPTYEELHPTEPSSSRPEILPTYTTHSEYVSIQDIRDMLHYDPARIHDYIWLNEHGTQPRLQDISIWKRFIESAEMGKWTDDENVVPLAIEGLFTAIKADQQDVIGFLIENHLATTDSRREGQTPLLAAIEQRNNGIAKQLLNFGADPNAFGSVSLDSAVWKGQPGWDYIQRTPVQLAASLGNLVLVKILMEQYHADDSLIAPDGQIALRLAAENGHREVVDYLPARRGGGFRRWKHKNKKLIQRSKKAVTNMAKFVKFFVWDIEKFFLWTIPKHAIVKPLKKSMSWCWEQRKSFGPWLKRQMLEMPGRIKGFMLWLGKVPKELYRGVVKTCQWSWKFITTTLPHILKTILLWAWKVLTVRIPKTLALLGKWLLNGFTGVVRVLWNALLKIVSWLSTIFEAIVTFFKALTLADIWNGFCDMLKAVFVEFPKLIFSWISALGKGSYKLMKSLFGEVGACLWYIGVGIAWVVLYMPGQLWKVVESMASSCAKGTYEVRVWLNPKAR